MSRLFLSAHADKPSLRLLGMNPAEAQGLEEYSHDSNGQSVGLPVRGAASFSRCH
jgi:hypothetical protein